MNRHESHEDPTLIDLGRVTTEDSSESSEGAVHRDDGPMDEGSSSNGHSTQTSESSNLQIAKEETKAVVRSKVGVYVVLALLALATAAGTWYYVRQDETNEFEHQVRRGQLYILSNCGASHTSQ